MADLNRPDYGQVWASTGEKVAPDTVKMQSGWVQEMMPFQYENYLQARQDEAIVYLLQKGVPEYSSTQEYISNKSVVVYQGNLYMATATVTNVLPTVTASWKRLNPSLLASGAVPVSSGGTGATTASEARTNLGLGSIATSVAPSTNGIVVKDANDSLVARTITGTSGNIAITNPDGVAGNININVGSNVAQLSQDSSWTSKGGIRLPSGSTGERGIEVAGKIRYNTTLQKFEGFNGTSWNALGASSDIEITTLSGNGATTTFTLNADVFSAVATDVYIGGIYQNKASYSVSGSTITFSEAPVAGVDNIQVLSRRVVDLGLSTATQISIQDTTNLYTSSTVEGALREVGDRAKYVKNAILSFPDYASASAAAATLPDTQRVVIEEDETRGGRSTLYVVQSGALVYQGLAGDAGSISFVPVGTGSVATDVQAKLRESVSVKDYGAVGNGIAIDTDSFQAAYDSVPNGGEIIVPGPGPYIVGTLTGTKEVIWVVKFDINTNLGLLNLPGKIRGGFSYAELLRKNISNGAEFATFRLDRIANYDGGSSWNVCSNIRATTTVSNNNAKSFEWVGTFVLNNSGQGQNVAVYGQGNRMAGSAITLGGTFAGVFEAKDTTEEVNPASGLIGLEVDVFANGTDSLGRRVAIDVVAGKGVTAGAKCEVGHGIRFVPVSSDSTRARFRNVMTILGDKDYVLNVSGTGVENDINIVSTGGKIGSRIGGTHSDAGYVHDGTAPYGFRFSGTYSSGAAIRMPSGTGIAFESTGAIQMNYVSGAMRLVNAGVVKTSFSTTDGSMSVSGNKVVGVRDIGWAPWTGTSNKATAYDVSTATLAQVCARVAALQAALTTHGLIGV